MNEITSFTVLSKEIEVEIHDSLNEPPKEGESNALQKARDFFASCMNTTKIEELGAKPGSDFIAEFGWPICPDDKWGKKNKKWDVYAKLEKLQRQFYPAPPFFTVEVTHDHLNSTKHLIKVSVRIFITLEVETLQNRC